MTRLTKLHQEAVGEMTGSAPVSKRTKIEKRATPDGRMLFDGLAILRSREARLLFEKADELVKPHKADEPVTPEGEPVEAQKLAQEAED